MRQRAAFGRFLIFVFFVAALGPIFWNSPSVVAQSTESASPTPAKPFKHRKLRDPIQLADGLEIVYYWIAPRVAWDNSFQIYGEIVNKTDRTLDAPAFRFALYDEDGNTLGGVSALPHYHVIPPW